jgi:hypothetical protein
MGAPTVIRTVPVRPPVRTLVRTLVRALVWALFAALCLTPATLAAQGTQTPGKTEAVKVKPKGGPKPFDKKQLAERLQNFKDEIATKIVPPRAAKKSKKRVEKWLKGFQIVQGKHYHVFTNGPKTTSKRFAKSLEELYEFVNKLWPFEELAHHHRAYIFSSKEEYYDFCTNVVGWSRASAVRSAGHANGAYYAAYYQSPKSEVVMHEATHQIVHANLKIRGVGSWFQEGMAEFAANTILGNKVSGSMRTDLRNGNYYPFPQFVKIPSLIADRASSRNYTHSGCFIEFMMKTKDPRMAGKFLKFLETAASRQFGYGRGEGATVELFRKVYGMTLTEADAAFLAFHRVKPKR